jgi:adenylate cyclase
MKFLGDGLLATFDLEGRERDSICSEALQSAYEMVAGVAEANGARRASGLPTMDLDIALHLGDVLYGNVGAADRLDFTVIGPAVNEVSRIESMCRALDQDLVISAAFAEAVKPRNDRLASLGRYVLRGVRRPQELYTLVATEDLA